MSRHHASRSAFLLASGVLMFAMLLASDVIVELAHAQPLEALALTLLALAALSMAGRVVRAMDQARGDHA